MNPLNPDKQYLAIHPHRLLIEGDASVFLQLTRPEDSEELYRLVHANRHHLRKYQRWAKDINFEELHRSVQDTVSKIEGDKWMQYRIMIPRAGGDHQMIGTVTLFERNVHQATARLSYWLAESEQGKGYARRGVQRLLEHAFKAWGLHQVFLEVQIGNQRAEGLALRLGAQPTDEVAQEELEGEIVSRRKWVLERI
jgi:RimJ/RimL family protein N-acetyltransferase